MLYCFKSCTAHNPAPVLCHVSHDGGQPEQKCQTSAGEPFSFPFSRKDTRISVWPLKKTKQARHDIRHHFVQLSSLAEQGDMEKIKKYLSATTEKISDYNLHFCENQAVDSVFGYYSTLAQRENIPFHAVVSLPADLSIDEINLCLVFSNLLENAIQASVKQRPPAERLMWKFIPTIIICF